MASEQNFDGDAVLCVLEEVPCEAEARFCFDGALAGGNSVALVDAVRDVQLFVEIAVIRLLRAPLGQLLQLLLFFNQTG